MPALSCYLVSCDGITHEAERLNAYRNTNISIAPIQEPQEMFPTWLKSQCAPHLQVEGTQNLYFECLVEILIMKQSSFILEGNADI